MLVIAGVDGVIFADESPFQLIQAPLAIGFSQSLDFKCILTELPHVPIEWPVVTTNSHLRPVLTPAPFHSTSRLSYVAFSVDFVSKQVDKHIVRLSQFS